jgi:RNA polymerase sigma-70 factor (ECF subfamily)
VERKTSIAISFCGTALLGPSIRTDGATLVPVFTHLWIFPQASLMLPIPTAAVLFFGSFILKSSLIEGKGTIPMNTEESTRDEAQMIASILDGDTEQYHNLVKPHELSVYRMALSFMRNESDAEDVAQEAFLSAFRNLAKFRGQAKFSTWLISITLNEARRRLRRQGVVQMRSLDGGPGETAHTSPALLRDWREIPSETLERKELCNILREGIDRLSPIYREILLLRDVEELSIEQTASTLTISTASVRVRLHRARLMLQKDLAPKLKAATPRRRWLR